MDDAAINGFLDSLPVLEMFSNAADAAAYAPLPDGWSLALADIVESTGAIAAGRYKSVNMAGAGVISGLLNAFGRHDLPFSFGGDGAVVAIPPDGTDTARAALAGVLRWVEDELGLKMRGAIIAVTDIRAAGHDVRIARHRASEDVSYAMFAGGGTRWADARMKDGLYPVEPAAPRTRPDLTGLSCRWNPIASRHGHIASIIAVPGAAGNGPAFAALVMDIVSLMSGVERDGHPVPAGGPTLGLSQTGMDFEARAVARPGARWKARLTIRLQQMLVVILRRFNMTAGRFDPQVYLKGVTDNSDFRKFEDGLKMTLDIDDIRLAAIRARLDAAARRDICRFGIHTQSEALMTCIVPSPMSRDHLHFIDGASGGYAQAASRLKEQDASSGKATQLQDPSGSF